MTQTDLPAHERSSKLRYRPELDGLRAIAVIAVLFYHLDFEWAKGGFVGVDVFFVLSGYLITNLIYVQTQAGTFNFRQFYMRRIRRLAPAYIFTMIVVLIGGFLLFSLGDFARLGRELQYAALGLSNFYYWLNTDYFSEAKILQPVIHTWSLSVEEQFYLIWPLVLCTVLATAVPRISAIALVIIVAVGAFATTAFLLPKHSQAAFFLTLPRSWEFMAGAILVFVRLPGSTPRWLNEILICLGIALIIFTVATLSDTKQFPGLNAVVPCLGAMCVIAAGRTFISGSVLSSAPFVWIGRISYSLYLIHWLAIVYFDYYKFTESPTNVERMLVAAISIAAAGFMYLFVETPFRSNVTGQKRRQPIIGKSDPLLITGLLASVFAILLVSANVWANYGWKWRVPNATEQVIAGYGGCEKKIGCVVGDPEGRTVFLVGDSHALHLVAGLNELGKTTARKIVVFASPSCNMTSYEPRYENAFEEVCEETKTAWQKALSDAEDFSIVLAQRWKGYPDLERVQAGMLDFVSTHSDRSVAVVGQLPQASRSLQTCGQRPAYILSENACDTFTKDQIAENYRNRWQLKLKDRSNVSFIDGVDVLCSETVCAGTIDGQNVYSDAHHLSKTGSVYLVDNALREFMAN